jgi:DNA polymerase I-like protein with 3'-5' exonuclease and polymerase domains
MDTIQGLRKLKEFTIPILARKGGFEGVDGRFVRCDNEHLMLAGMLQNGEAVVMKEANLMWRREADKEGLTYHQVGFIHDEWQTEVPDEETAERIGLLQRSSITKTGESLVLNCPLAGSTSIARDWSGSH